MENTATRKTAIPQIGSRIQWLDVLKGILIFNVVLSHSYPPTLYQQIYTPFFLTMFFFASGYTFSVKNSFKEFMVKKVFRLIIPFLFLGTTRIMAYQILEGGSIIERLKGFALQINGRYDEMWFISCMFTSSVIFYLVVVLCRRQKRFSSEMLILVVSTSISVIGFADICIFKIKFIWELETACMMLAYMALGYCYRHRGTKVQNRIKVAVSVTLLTIIYICITLFVNNDVNIHSQIFQKPILFVFASMIVIPPIICISKLLCNTFLHRALAFLGANTLFYYAYAGFIRILFYAGCDYLGISNEWILPILCALASAVLMAFPAWLVKKYIPWLVGGGKTKKLT